VSARRFILMSLLALALGGAASVLVACNDRNGLIPRAQGEAIKTDLDKASSNFDAQECRKAEANIQNASDKVVALPRSVDARLRQNLAEGVKTVGDDIVTTCGKSTTTTATTPTQTTQTTQTDTTPTDTTPTTTTPTDTPPTDTTPTAPTPTDGTSGGTPVNPATGSAGGQGANSGEQKNFKVRGRGRGNGNHQGNNGGGGD
jgi:hypothetical protein